MSTTTESGRGPAPTPAKSTQPIYIRLWPIYIIAAGFALAFSQGWHQYLTLEALAENAVWLDEMVRNNLLLVLGAYIAVYAVSVAFMIPGSALTIGGGFLFPTLALSLGGAEFGVPLVATAATVIGATLGASILFAATKTSIGSVLRDIAGPFLGKMEKEFDQNALSYMFALRLVPAVPFAVANIAPGLLGAKYRDYLITTFFGIIPGSLAYTWIGSAIKDTVLQAAQNNESIDVGALIAPLASNVLPAFIALGLVSLIPILYKKVFQRTPAAEGAAS